MSDAIQQAGEILRSLRLEANALNVAIYDRDGSILAHDFDGNFDLGALLTDIGEAPEREFDVIDETGPKHIKLEHFADGRFTLFVMYDDHSTLGLVRLAIKKRREAFAAVLGAI